MTMQMESCVLDESPEAIRKVVLEIVHKCLGKAARDLVMDSKFADLGAHSLDIVTIAFELEDRFDIEIHRRNLDDFKSLQQAVDVVAALLAERRASHG